jgi:hypothetical protein
LWVALGGDPRDAAQIVAASQQMSAGGGSTGTAPARSPEDDTLAQFVSVVLADTEDVWKAQFKAAGAQYREPGLVLFSGSVQSACGRTSAAVGPFYCPADEKAYIDLSFYQDLRKRFGAPGDFAQAYVIAHEVGHHVQNITGVSAMVDKASRGRGTAEVNALSVRQELQADCYAGVWAHHADRERRRLEEGDVEEALRAAKAIGDDALQKQAQGYSVPETWTHGSSAMRAKWLTIGLRTGDIRKCDTFSASAAEVGLGS